MSLNFWDLGNKTVRQYILILKKYIFLISIKMNQYKTIHTSSVLKIEFYGFYTRYS